MIHNLDANCPTSGHELWHHKKQYIPPTGTCFYISIKNFHYIVFYLPKENTVHRNILVEGSSRKSHTNMCTQTKGKSTRKNTGSLKGAKRLKLHKTLGLQIQQFSTPGTINPENMIEKARGKRGGERRKIRKKEYREIEESKRDKWRKKTEKGKNEKKKRE